MTAIARNPIAWFLALGMGLFLAGCGDDPETIDLKSRFATGGYAYYDLGGDGNGQNPNFLVRDVPVEDVTVLLTDVEGSEDSTVSDATGYYEITALQSGSYTWNVTATGYDPMEGTFALTTTEDFIENNLSMTETTPTMTAAWGTVSVTLEDNDQLVDGLEGVSADYSAAAHTTMTVTFSIPMGQGVSVDLFGGSVGTLDASLTVLTITEAEVDAVPAGFRTLSINGCWLTPIHGTFRCVSSQLDFTLGV